MLECVRLCADAETNFGAPRCEHRFSRSNYTPDASGRFVVLSLERLKKHIAIDVLNRSVTVDAGVTLQRVERNARASWSFLPD